MYYATVKITNAYNNVALLVFLRVTIELKH